MNSVDWRMQETALIMTLLSGPVNINPAAAKPPFHGRHFNVKRPEKGPCCVLLNEHRASVDAENLTADKIAVV